MVASLNNYPPHRNKFKREVMAVVNSYEDWLDGSANEELEFGADMTLGPR
jgi:hypothetical protein